MSKLALALAITAEVFKNKVDKQGKPYMLHCLYVMDGMDPDDEDQQIIGLMHDVPEDTDITTKMLREMGFSERVCKALDLLNHDLSEDYQVYIKRLALDPDTKKVKKRDLTHNSNITRLKGLRKKDFDRLEKYHYAYQYLS